MDVPSSLFLIGPMGAGKSTIGRRLAQVLGMTFRDSDSEIERRTGADIPRIFDIEGEAGFRRREHEILDELTRLPGVVLATGGGAVLDTDNRALLAERGSVIYLHASIDQQLRRTARDRKRPLLQTRDPRARLKQLMAARDPLYREIADLIVDTDGRSVPAVVKDIVRHLRAPAPGVLKG